MGLAGGIASLETTAFALTGVQTAEPSPRDLGKTIDAVLIRAVTPREVQGDETNFVCLPEDDKLFRGKVS